MSDGFDPYREWLEIRGDRRPPSHYDLLGLAIFESDGKRISAAAMARMQLLRSFTLGPDRDTALRLIAEVTAALACFSDAERKRGYDHELRAANTLIRGPAADETRPASPAPPIADNNVAQTSPAVGNRTGRAARPPARGSWNILPQAVAADAREPISDPAATGSSERNLVLWCLGGVVAAVVLLLFSARSYFRPAPDDLASSSDPSASDSTGRAAVHSFSGIPTPVAASADGPRPFEGSGRLLELMGHDGEVHLVLRTHDQEPTAECEAFTRQEGFAEQVGDYRSGLAGDESSDRGDGDRGDTVRILGATPGPNSVQPKFRLRPELPLVDLQEIERQGDSNSRAVVGQKRDPHTLRAGFTADPLRFALRFHPKTGETLSFSARLLEEIKRRQIKLRPVSGGEQTVEFPGTADDRFFADYLPGDLVDVAAIVLAGSARAPLQMSLQSILRHGEPTTLVTRSGRAQPVKGLDAAIKRWDEARDDPCNHLQETVELLGLYAGNSGGERGGSLQIHCNASIYHQGALKLFWAASASCHDFLSMLKPGEPLAVTATVLGGEVNRPILAVVSLANRNRPEQAFAFPNVQEAARVPGALLRRWKSLFGPRSSLPAWSSDGRFLMHAATKGAEYEIVLRDVDQAADLRFPIGSTWPMAVTFSHDGKRVALVDAKGTIQLWDVSQRSKLPRDLKSSSRDTRLLPGVCLVWNADDSKLWLSAPGLVQACLLSDGARRTISSLSDCKLLAAHPLDRNLVAGVSGNGKWVTLADLHEDKATRSIVLEAGADAYRNMLARQIGPKQSAARPGGAALPAPAVHPVDAKAIERFLAKQVVSWSSPPVGRNAQYLSVSWNPAGDHLAIAAQYAVEVWDVSEKRESRLVQTLAAEGVGLETQPSGVEVVAWSPSGDYLAAAAGRSLEIWSVDGWKERIRAELGYVPIEAISWRPDSTALAIQCSDGSLQVLYVADGPTKQPAAGGGDHSGVQPPRPAATAAEP